MAITKLVKQRIRNQHMGDTEPVWINGAESPNQKWVTDISYIKTGQGFLYLSVIRDLFDNSVVAYKTGTEQNINLVLSTIRTAKKKEKVTAELQLHSDQGFQ